jgi:hypothetical protein
MPAFTDDKPAIAIDHEVDEEKGLDPSRPRIRCPKCGWSPRKEDRWTCDAGICGTPSTLAGYALRASTNGLLPSASHVSSGRHTRIGMRNDLLMLAFDGKVAADTKA